MREGGKEGLIEILAKEEVGEGGREKFDAAVEVVGECKVSERKGVVHSVSEFIAEEEVKEGPERLYWSIKFVSKNEVGERRREVTVWLKLWPGRGARVDFGIEISAKDEMSKTGRE